MEIGLHPFSVYLIVLIRHPSRIASRRFRFHLIFEAACSASCSFNQSFGVDSEWDIIKFLFYFFASIWTDERLLTTALWGDKGENFPLSYLRFVVVGGY